MDFMKEVEDVQILQGCQCCACPRETQADIRQKSHTPGSQAICSQREACELCKYASQEIGKTHIVR